MMGARLERDDARHLADLHGVDLARDFHALTTEQVESVISAADAHGYRKPRDANGSRGRSFHEYLRRAAGADA
jgi:hypothetical protein